MIDVIQALSEKNFTKAKELLDDRIYALVDETLEKLKEQILIEMFDAARVERGRAALNAVDNIALLQEGLCQIGSVLACDPGNEGSFLFGHGDMISTRMC